MSKEEVAALLEKGLANGEAQTLREQVGASQPTSAQQNGFRLYIHYGFDGDAAGVGFATMTEMAAKLGEGAVSLFANG